VSKEVLPLDDKVKTEIHAKLKSEHMKEMMDKYTNSFQAVPNEAYFGPAGPAGPGGPGGMRQGPPARMPHPQMAPPPTQPQAQPQSAAPAASPAQQPPAGPAPPSKPN